MNNNYWYRRRNPRWANLLSADPNTKRAELSIKDATVLVPLCATSIAVSWEVGRFVPFSGFYLFTLSEHLLAAAGILPIALVYVIFVALMLALQRKLTRPKKINSPLLRFLFWTTLFVIYPATTAGIAWIQSSLGTLGVGVLFLPIVYVQVFYGTPLRNSGGILLLFFIVICGTMAMAIGGSFDRIRDARKSTDSLPEIVLKSETLRAYLVMSGERGLLFYDPRKDQTSFVRSEDLKAINWINPKRMPKGS